MDKYVDLYLELFMSVFLSFLVISVLQHTGFSVLRILLKKPKKPQKNPKPKIESSPYFSKMSFWNMAKTIAMKMLF